MKTSNTKTPRKRLYVGHKRCGASDVFRFAGKPTSETHGNLYFSVTGPFRTRRGADYFAANPFCGCVSDAEELAALHAGQSELCARFAKHLENRQKTGE